MIRKTKPKTQTLFEDEEVGSSWDNDWWGMPEYVMEDALPQRRLVVNFLTQEDVDEFVSKLGIKLGEKCRSIWYPTQERITNNEYSYVGKPTACRYPICIPSKGRADCQLTGHALDKLGVDYKFFVEETEYESYCHHVGKNRVVKLPFHDLGQGSIPARNFIWDWAKENGHARHWVVDDNIGNFYRLNYNARLRVDGGGFFAAMEDFADRYENLALVGPHDRGFIHDRNPRLAPFLLNTRIYSCILIDTNLQHRWRGRYNEDTDLSLRVLKDGYCTAIFRAFLMRKHQTVSTSKRGMKGGNTDHVYNTGDHRLAFAKSLQEQHPDCVEVVWKYDRWHHKVDYSAFKNNQLKLRPGLTPTKAVNNYGMVLQRNKRTTEDHNTGE